MLKKWIEEIRAQQDLYKTDSWKYRISGNVIEMSILPVYLKDKKKYRCAVIAVGQVLKALTSHIERNNSNFHIQSFPTLEDPGVVATIRIDENSAFIRSSGSANHESTNKNNPELIIQTQAKQYQLDVQEIEVPEFLQVENVDSNDFNTWFALYSIFNNPFTWLNIGYWKESVKNEYNKELTAGDFKIIDFCIFNHEEQPDLKIPENRCLQSIIGINTKAVTDK